MHYLNALFLHVFAVLLLKQLVEELECSSVLAMSKSMLNCGV
jgi:hypothetical protein